jgi:hypothetical protein
LRFAVHRPGNPVASPRSHGVPRRDVPGRVHVGVDLKAAGAAPESRLALSRFRVAVPAARTGLRRVRRISSLDPARGLIFQTAYQQPPAGPQDSPIEPALLADIPPWVLSCAFGRPGHVLDPKVLDPDHVKTPSDIGAGFLHPVFASIGFAGAQPAKGLLHLPATIRTPLSASEFTLQATQSLLLPRYQARCQQQCARRQGRGHRHAPIDPYRSAVPRTRDGLGNRCEGNVPAPGAVKGYTVGLHAFGHRPGPTKPHPPSLRDPDVADLTGRTTQVPLPAAPYDPKSLIPPGLAPPRAPGWVLPVEERSHRLGEVPQRLLLHRLGTCGQPRVSRPSLGELSALLQIAGSTLASQTPVRVLLDRKIPHVTGVRAVVPQHRFLGGRREQPVSGHTNTLANSTDIFEEVKRSCLPGLKAQGSTPRAR